LAADRLVSGRQRAELGVEYEAYGDQVTVKHNPDDHVNRHHDHLGCVNGGPYGWPVVHGLGHAGQPHVVDGLPVSTGSAVIVFDLHVTDAGEQR